MPFIKRTSQPTLHYRVDDHTDPWTSPRTVLLQHGYGRNSRFCTSWVPYLSRRYRVIRPDLRGHGESPVDFDPATGSTIEGYLGDVIAVLDELGIDAVHYCGESFGGIIGMVLAATHPERVRTLTLVSSPVYQDQKAQDSFAAGFPTRDEALRTLGVPKWAKAIYGAPGFLPEGTDAALRAWYVSEIAKSDVEVLCGLYGLLRHASAQEFLPRIQAPVLGLYPTAGALASVEQEELLKKGILNLRMVHLPTRSHAILTLRPAECAGHLLEFITQHNDGEA